MQIYIGNIPPDTTEEELTALFTPFGEVVSLFLARDRQSGKSRGFGFVEMEREAAERAVAALANSSLKGWTLRVNAARPANPRPPRDTW